MKNKTQKTKLTGAYFISSALLFVGGILWILANYEFNILRLVGLHIVILGCAMFNLLYFLPIKQLFLRLLSPGIISIIAFILLNRGSSVERDFSLGMGIINLLIGIGWLIKKVWDKK